MIENTDDTTYLWNRFLEALKDVTNNNCTKKSICSHSKPYWNDNLTLLCNQMRIARKRYQSRNTDYNYANYAEAKKEFDDSRKAACSEFLLKQTQNLNTSEANQFWNTFNKTFGSKSNEQIGPLLIDKGEYVLNDHKIEAALFATFFEGKHIINNLKTFNSDFNDINASRYDKLLDCHIHEQNPWVDQAIDQQPLPFNAPFTKLEVKKALSAVKSFDKCGFHPTVWKYMGILSLQFLLNLFNLCLAQGVWPWENLEVIFIRKTGKSSYEKPGAYRPTSITSYVGKLLEKLVCFRLQKSFFLN